MDAIEIPDRASWLEWRRQGLGASDAGTIAGCHGGDARIRLFLEKTGRIEPMEANRFMRWGILLEDAIAEAYSERTGCLYRASQECLQSKEHPFIRATLDRVRHDGTIVELKAVSLHGMRRIGEEEEGMEGLPDAWIYQAQHQMFVAEADLVEFAVFVPSFDLRVFRVPRNDPLIEALLDLEICFWDGLQADRPPPDLTPEESLLLANHTRPRPIQIPLSEDVSRLASELEEVNREIRSQEARKDALKASILEAMGDVAEGLLPDGRIISRKLIEIPGGTREVKASKFTRIDIKKPKGTNQ